MDLKYRRWWKMYYRHLTALFVEDIREEGGSIALHRKWLDAELELPSVL